MSNLKFIGLLIVVDMIGSCVMEGIEVYDSNSAGLAFAGSLVVIGMNLAFLLYIFSSIEENQKFTDVGRKMENCNCTDISKCQHCGWINPPTDSTCIECGRTLL